MKRQIIFSLSLLFTFQTIAWSASTDMLIKERRQHGKPIRTRMPPQIFIETIQKQFNANSPEWKTFWQNFTVEDDDVKDEFVIVARSYPKKWAFSLLNPNCPKPEDYDQFVNDIARGGTQVRMDALVGIRRSRSFFRYTVTVYEPLFDLWKNPCYEWSLAPGTANDAFYKDNNTTKVYADNLSKQTYEAVSAFDGWKSPKKLMKIPAIRGAGQELIGAEADSLTDDEKKLSIEEQEKLLKKRKKGKME